MRMMIRFWVGAVLAVLVGCAPPGEMTITSRDVAPVVMRSQYDVKAVQISVPASLVVSEANLIYPRADIVWRGDPPGDRHAQVKAIFEEAFAAATGPMKQGPAVTVRADVVRFHALSEKARYLVGGVYDMVFILTVTEQSTGVILDGPREVSIDARASGGRQAVADDAAGRTERVVVLETLTAGVRRLLSAVVSDKAVQSAPKS